MSDEQAQTDASETGQAVEALPAITELDFPATPKQAAFVAYRAQGYNIADSAIKAGYREASLPHVYREIEPKRKVSVLSPLLHAAKRAVKEVLLTGKPGERLRAAEIVLDRVEPKVQRIDARTVSVELGESRTRLQGLVIPSRSVTPRKD